MHGVRRIRWLLTAVLVLMGLAAAPAAARVHGSPTRDHHQPTAERVCHQSPDPLVASCTAMARTDLPPMAQVPPNARPPGFSPQDLRRAYRLNGQRGRGRTVAITVAFHHPNIASDLAVYRRQFGLPPCTTDRGCLRVINQRGGSTLPTTVAPDWSFEEAIDVDMVSAACSDCRILVIEADDPHLSNLLAGVDQAVAQGAKFVTNSWFVNEDPAETAFDFHFSNNPGVVFNFASGDSGGLPVWPSTSPYVTSVGGTSLIPLHTPRGFGETAWGGTGCGCSLFEPKPAFQHDAICPNNRTTADLSAVADPGTGVAVYTSVPAFDNVSGWLVAGGTSVSSPLVAGMYALAGNPAPGTFPNSYPYAHPQDFFDITVGSAGSFSAVPGYDAPTGIGTPDGVAGLRDPWDGWHGGGSYGDA